jgi:hypothetical protein
MNRRNALVEMARWLTGIAISLVPIKERRQEYNFSEIEQARELTAVLATAVYENKIRYYTCEFKDLIVVCWG